MQCRRARAPHAYSDARLVTVTLGPYSSSFGSNARFVERARIDARAWYEFLGKLDASPHRSSPNHLGLVIDGLGASAPAIRQVRQGRPELAKLDRAFTREAQNRPVGSVHASKEPDKFVWKIASGVAQFRVSGVQPSWSGGDLFLSELTL
jgi:hypothetical protein